MNVNEIKLNSEQIDEQTDELLADIVCFAEMFERLSPDDKESMLEFLRQLNNTK